MLKHAWIAAALALACPAVTGAATLDMSFSGLTDTMQVVPMGGDKYVVTSNQYWGTRSIAAPDGTLWTGNPDPARPITHSFPGTGVPYIDLPPLPSGMEPSHWTRGTDGKLWFTEAQLRELPPAPLDRIGRLDPATGAVTEFAGLTAGAEAQSIANGSDGNVWFLEYGTNSVGRITPGGVVTEFPLPSGVALRQQRGEELTTGPGGDLFFLTATGVGRMTTAGVYIDTITGGLSDFSPNAVAYGSDGNLWVTECDANTVARISPTGAVYRMPPGQLPTRACPMGMVAAPDGVPWFYEWNTARVGRVLFDTPLARTDDPTSISYDAADLNGRASPRGVATTVHFEYGTTTAYGSATPDQSIGDGDDGVDVTARPSGLQPLTTYHYRLVATSVAGTVRGDDQTVTTGLVPPPPPPPLPVDRDGDGYAEAVDCDDLSAAIHPGARDNPGDRIDQDCSGGDAAYARFQPHASAGWKRVAHGRIEFTRLVIDQMPSGSSLRLTCSGRGCKLKPYTSTMTRTVTRLDLTKRLKKAHLGKGATVELTLSRPGYVTTIVRWVIASPVRTSILCQAPGAKKPSAC